MVQLGKGGVSYTISATDVSKEAVESAIAGTKRLNSSVDTMESKMKSQFSNMQKYWLEMAAAIAVAYKAIGAISGIVMAAARYETLGVVMRVVGNNAGYTGAQVEAFAKGLERAGISMSGSRQALTRMAQAQLDLSKSAKLARIAQDAAVIGAMNSTEAFNQMVYGIQSANVRVLRTIGINVSFEESYQKVAKQLGRTAESLTVSEKAAIRLQAVLDAGPTIAGAYSGAMETAGKQLFSLERHFDNLKVLAGAAFTPALAEIIETITATVVDLNGELSGESKTAIAEWGTGFRISLISVEAEFTRVSMFIDKIGGSLTQMKALLFMPGTMLGIESSIKGYEAAIKANQEYQTRYETSDKALEALALKQIKLEESLTDAGKAATAATLDALEKKRMAATKINEVTEKSVEIDKKALAEREKNAAAYYAGLVADATEADKELIAAHEGLLKMEADQKTAQAKLIIEINKGMYASVTAEAQEYTDAIIGGYKDMLTYEKKMKADEVALAKKAADDKKKLAEQLPGMYRDVYKDIRGYEEDYYDSSMQMIADQASAYSEAGMEQAVIADWVAEEMKKADEKKTLSNGTFIEGFKLGLTEMEEAEKTWAERGKELSKDLHDFKKGLIDAGVTAFMEGENAMIALQEYGGKTISALAGKYATEMLEKAIGQVISMIGAYIGMGASGSGAQASSGGVGASIGAVGLYLVGAVGAMLGGKALANQFRAEGGWIGAHPYGGIIQQGSGMRDDVYLGRTENTRHWGMGGEFVVNKESTARFADLLVAINSGRMNRVTDTGFAEGGWTGHKGQALVGDPDDLALRCAGGGQLCFGAAFGKAMAGGANIYAAIGAGVTATVLYIVSAMGGALGGKALGKAFMAEGGPIQDMGHWWNPLSLLVPPGFPDPFNKGKMAILPGLMWQTQDPQQHWDEILKWIDDMWKEFLESQRAGWFNYAEYVLTPGTDVSDISPIDDLKHEMEHFGQHLLNVNYLLLKPPGISFAWEDMREGGFVSARKGLDYVPYDNFPARLHKGERVQTEKEAEKTRSGRGNVSYTFNLYATVADKKAVNEFADQIYPRLKRLEAWGH
ncbi:MAG: hypothetical protein ABIJ57_08620 [Pseudomonadota bacterium]